MTAAGLGNETLHPHGRLGGRPTSSATGLVIFSGQIAYI